MTVHAPRRALGQPEAPAGRRRICRIIARMNVGGPAVQIIQLTTGLDSQRFEQLIVTGREGPGEASLLPEARERGIQPLIIPELGREISLAADARALWKLYRLFRRWRPHVVETHTAKAGTLGRLAAVLAGVPVRLHIFHGHVFHGYFSRRKTAFFLAVERGLARVSTGIIALGEEQRSELLGYGIGRPEQMLAIPLGLELAPFLSAEREAGRLRRELAAAGVPAGAPLVGIVGRLVPIKAHEVFLAGAARILEAIPEAHFVVVGDGERRDELTAMASQPPLAGRVHFLGWRSREDVVAIYADLDLVALTSDNEGMPTTIIEAMAAGRPVVSTDVGGVRSLVVDGQTGRLVRPRSPEALAAAAVELLRSPARRQEMGQAARDIVYPRFDVTTLVSTMGALYDRLIDGSVGER